MLVVIPVCAKDEALVLKNLDWLSELDGKINATALIAYPIGFDAQAVIDKAKSVFGWFLIAGYDDWKGDPKWPQPQNWAWQSAARNMVSIKEPWLWWEADSTPLIKGWYDAIKCEYLTGKKPFMGCIMERVNGFDPHMNGVGVYPADVGRHSHTAMLCRSAPFDVVMWRDTQQHTHRANHIIQHHCRENGDSTHFPDHASVESIIRPGVVLFHRCKDGSLIDRLREAKPMGKLKSFFSRKWIEPPKPKPFPIVAHLDSSSGYGQFGSSIALELKSRGYAVELYPPSMNEIHGKLLPGLKEMIRTTPSEHDWALVFYPSVVQPANLVLHVNRKIQWSMYEATRLTPAARGFMNRCVAVFNPSAYGANCFSAYGVDVPIRVVPLGIDISKWPTAKQKTERELVFGTAGKTASGGIRKGFNVVIEAFRMAFPTEKHTRLRIKAFQEDPIPDTYGDDRIDVVREYYEHSKFVEWMHSINVFVSGSTCEGWGLIQQQAMCCGRPVIGVNYGGVCEFINEHNTYPVDWHLVPAEGIYRDRGGGSYPKLHVESMAVQMKRAFEDRNGLRDKAELSTISARRFTLENSANKLIEAMKDFNFPI